MSLPSPCRNVCRMDEVRGTCIGCWRTLDEIAAWSALDEAGQRAVRQACVQRRTQAMAAASHDSAPCNPSRPPDKTS